MLAVSSRWVTPGHSSFARAAAWRFAAAFGPAARRFKRFTAGAALFVAALTLQTGPAAAQQVGDDPIVIVAFGDSLIAGYGLPVAEGFAPRLEEWLHANGASDAIVINAGVSGDTTSGGLARLDWAIGPEADAVILELGANDALRGIAPEIARANLDQMLTRLAERGLPVLLAGMLAPRNWGQEYIDEFEPIYPELAEKHGAQLYPFFLEGVVGDPALFQSDRLHPNAEGVMKLVETIGPAVLALVKEARAARQKQ